MCCTIVNELFHANILPFDAIDIFEFDQISITRIDGVITINRLNIMISMQITRREMPSLLGLIAVVNVAVNIMLATVICACLQIWQTYK